MTQYVDRSTESFESLTPSNYELFHETKTATIFGINIEEQKPFELANIAIRSQVECLMLLKIICYLNVKYTEWLNTYKDEAVSFNYALPSNSSAKCDPIKIHFAILNDYLRNQADNSRNAKA